MNKEIKIFISHSSKNKDYGDKLIELLTGIGIKDNQIIYTSNTAFGIPLGQNIFNWLKNSINEKPFVIYLLSTEYYSSIACLNEMGAAWVIENDHAMIFTPLFDLSCEEFRNGALDPREIGFYINDADRLTEFIEKLKQSFSVTSNQIIINQKCNEFLSKVNSINNTSLSKEKVIPLPKEVVNKSHSKDIKSKVSYVSKSDSSIMDKFTNEFSENKLKDEEIILLYYTSDTAKHKLGTGWQEAKEIANIRIWEEKNELKGILSSNYENTLRRLDMKKLIEVSELTGYGNPKEYKLIEELSNFILENEEIIISKYEEIKAKVKVNKNSENFSINDLPF